MPCPIVAGHSFSQIEFPMVPSLAFAAPHFHRSVHRHHSIHRCTHRRNQHHDLSVPRSAEAWPPKVPSLPRLPRTLLPLRLAITLRLRSRTRLINSGLLTRNVGQNGPKRRKIPPDCLCCRLLSTVPAILKQKRVANRCNRRPIQSSRSLANRLVPNLSGDPNHCVAVSFSPRSIQRGIARHPQQQQTARA